MAEDRIKNASYMYIILISYADEMYRTKRKRGGTKRKWFALYPCGPQFTFLQRPPKLFQGQGHCYRLCSAYLSLSLISQQVLCGENEEKNTLGEFKVTAK